MKIMIVTPYYSPAVGGLENYARNIAKQLKLRGNDVFVVTTSVSSKVLEEDLVDGIKIIRLPVQLRLSNTPFHFGWKRMLKRIIQEERPDVINAHTPVPYISDMAAKAAGTTPFVLTYHNDLVKPSGIGKYLAKLFYVLYMNNTMRRANRIIVTSQYYANTSPYLAKHKHKLDIVSPGVDLDQFNQNVDKTWLRNQFPGKKIILFVASMKKSHAHKGFTILLKACSKLDRNTIPYQLVAVGGGDGIDGYKEQAKKLGILEHVTFTGYVSDEDLPKYFAGAHVFTLPSTSDAEGFGMVLIEAQACGTPVIGSDIGGIPYAVGDAGIVVVPDDVNALAQAILGVSSNLKEYKDLSHAALKHSKSFDWNILAKYTEKVLKRTTLKTYTVVHTASYYPPHLGGMENAIEYLVMQFSSLVNPVVITSRLPNTDIEMNEAGIVRRLPAFEIAHTPIIPSLLSTLLMTRADIYHTHVSQAFIPEITALVAKFRHKPLIAHMHADVGASGKLGFMLGWYKRFLLARALRAADVVLCQTESLREIFVKKYKLPNVQIVPNGVSEHFLTDSIPKQPDKSRPFNIVYTGRLTVEKNIDLILKAVAKLDFPYRLTLIGSGEKAESLKLEAKKLGVESFIDFVGIKNTLEIKDIYKDSDVFVIASDYENQSLSLLEAFASGLPAVVVDSPGLRDAIANDGIVCQKTSMAIRKALIEIYSDSARYALMSATARKHASEFAWADSCKKIESIYESIA